MREITDRYKRNIVFIKLDEISRSMDVNTNFCRSTYGKLFLSQIEDVDIMLVFDCDTIVTGSLRDLLIFNMEDSLIAGVQDTVNPYFVRKIGLTNNDRYINCGGVIVLNLKFWRKMGTEKRCIDYVLSYGGNPPFVDQGTINYVCNGYTKALPPGYNVINPMFMFSVEKLKRIFKMKVYYSQTEIDDAKIHPKVVHFTGELYNRPWFTNCDHPLMHYYRDFLSISPWRNNSLIHRKMSMNCRIQKWIYDSMPFPVYLLMIRFIEVRHRLTKRIM